MTKSPTLTPTAEPAQKGPVTAYPDPSLSAQASAAHSTGQKDHSKPGYTPRRILIVDDNQDASDILVLMLSRLGHIARAEYDGRAAIKTAAEFHPEVILLDIGLPGLNGYEVARYLRAQPDGHRVVLIAATGWGQDEDKKRAHDAGFNFHMTKPLEPEALRKLLAELPTTTGNTKAPAKES